MTIVNPILERSSAEKCQLQFKRIYTYIAESLAIINKTINQCDRAENISDRQTIFNPNFCFGSF